MQDPRLSDDPLEALAAVMKYHSLQFHTIDGITISVFGGGILVDIDMPASYHSVNPITADDIKPEE